MSQLLNFEQWYDMNEDELSIIAAETGMDRELDFDWDRFIEKQYDDYILKHSKNNDSCIND